MFTKEEKERLEQLDYDLIEENIDPMEYVRIVNEMTDKQARKMMELEPAGNPKEHI